MKVEMHNEMTFAVKPHAASFAVCAAITVLATGMLHAAYNEDPADYELAGPTEFTAASGVTNVFSGLIYGTGSAVIKGGGTVAFSHPDNTYSGGTRVENAVFRLDANGCAGTGTITAAVNTAHIYMNCAYVPNDMRFLVGCSDGNAQGSLKPSDYPSSGTHPLYPLAPEIVVGGKVLFNSYAIYTSGTDASGFENSTVTFMKDFKTDSNNRLDIAAFGTSIFKGRYYSGSSSDYRQHVGCLQAAKGAVEFHATSNRINTCALYNSSIYLKAKDALPYSLLYNMSGNNEFGNLYLCGNDQTFRGVCWGTKADPPAPAPGENSTGLCWSSVDTPATVRIIGCASNTLVSAGGSPTFVNKLALFGKITLVMDVPAAFTASGFYQEFSVRRSTTSGDLVISNGDFRVSDTASFPNVPNIYVGTGGSFTNASTRSGAFAGCTNLTVLGSMACTGDTSPFSYDTVALTLGDDAKFSLPAGTVATFRSLKVGDDDMPDGTYGDGGMPLAQILQGTVVVRSRDKYVDCVNGDDANDGAAARPFKTICEALKNAVSGDVIHVAPGTYGALEGSQKWPSGSCEIGTRVVIPSGVTVESTEGAERTFIVGAPSPNPSVTEGWLVGIGPDAVRCVAAGSGATLRGFTLTGGYTHVGSASVTEDRYCSAFYTASENPATIEDCIISNNVASSRTMYYGVVRRCRVIGNTAAADGSDALSGAAGTACSWYNTIIAGNRGNGTMANSRAVESCTLGGGNVMTEAGASAQVLFWTGDARHVALVNTAWLYGRCQLYKDLYCTNCIIMSDILVGETAKYLRRENAHNTIFTNAAAAQVDEEWRPVLGSFVGIDSGDIAHSSIAFGDADVFGNQRIMNGIMDIGAVEYDWRPVFMAEFGRRFKIENASPEVTMNTTGGLCMPSGHISGTVSAQGTYEVVFEVAGGRLAVYAEGVLVGESSGSGVQSLRFEAPVASSAVRFIFTPDAENPGTAVLRKFSGASGFVVTFR